MKVSTELSNQGVVVPTASPCPGISGNKAHVSLPRISLLIIPFCTDEFYPRPKCQNSQISPWDSKFPKIKQNHSYFGIFKTAFLKSTNVFI